MEIRPLTDLYAVSPQISPADIATLKAQGFTAVIDNRPDAEIPADLHTAGMRTAVEAAGLRFFANPVIGGALTADNVTAQRAAMEAADGPVLAYCASGNRSSVVWALAMAGQMPTDDLIALPERHGYDLEPLRAQIEARAKA